MRAFTLKLTPLVATSGFAGLGYEMVWTRELSFSLGTDMMAVLGAIAGFFAGLALGAFLLDGPIRRARSPRAVYAALEAVIGLWGLVSIWLLPAAGRALPPLLGVEPAPGLLWAASFAVPALALLPATVAMGGTLTALERMIRTARADGRVSAGVYGANTAGAVAGTLVSAFVLFPAFGLSGTLLCLAALNGACALGALVFGPAASVVAPPVPQSKPHLRLGVTLFATGLLGIAFEVLVVRIAAQTLQDTIFTFASLLAAYLLGTAAGGLLWQRVGRAAGEATLGLLLSAVAVACMTTLALIPVITRLADSALGTGVVGELTVAVASFLLPSTAMGALFGHLAQQVRDQRGSLGWAVGINSVGAALAPLIASTTLLPTFGAWAALIAVAAGYLLLIPPRRSALLWGALPALACLVLSVRPAPILVRVPEGGQLLAVREGPMATASVVEDRSGARYLEVNGHFRMGGTNSVRSDYRQALLPLLLHPAPRRAIFLGVGTGATLVGGARLPGVSVRGVELSPEVVWLLPWFANADAGRPTPPITIADARRYVTADRSHYDVIIADLFHPALDGSGALYTVEHFRAISRRLAPGGLFCQWLPLYQLDLPSLRAIVRGFLDVYPDASAWLNHYSVRTPMLALVGRLSEGTLDVEALSSRLADPAVAAVVRPIGFETDIDVLGQYLGGARALRTLAGDGPRNTDDYPLVTLDARSNVRALTAPPSALLLTILHSLRTDPDELLAQGSAASERLHVRLPAYWRARDRFLRAGAALQGDPRGLALVAAASDGLLDAIRLSPEFDPAYRPLLSMARSLLASNPEAGERLLHAMQEAAPSRPEARELLSQGVN